MNHRLEERIRNALCVEECEEECEEKCKEKCEKKCEEKCKEECKEMEMGMRRLLPTLNGQLIINKRKRRIGFLELFFSQIRFIGVRIWSVELLIVLFSILVFRSFYQDFQYFTPRRIAFCLSCMTIIATMFALPFLYRSKRYLMMEIESAAYFSIRKILFFRFLLFFGGEAVLVTGAWAAAYVGQFVQGNMFVYVFVPLFLACDGVLFFLQNTPPDRFCRRYACYGGMLLFLLFIGYHRFPRMYEIASPYPALWVIALLLCYFVFECCRLARQSEEALY